MRADWADATSGKAALRVDGGMSASDWAMQFLSDIIDAPVDRPKVLETTALGPLGSRECGQGFTRRKRISRKAGRLTVHSRQTWTVKPAIGGMPVGKVQFHARVAL